jgi:hypothetical protein
MAQNCHVAEVTDKTCIARYGAPPNKGFDMLQRLFFIAVAAILLPACTTSLPSLSSSSARDLTPDEKKVIMDTLADVIKDPASAKFLWAKVPGNLPSNEPVYYCAAVNAKSPHPAYNGLQPYGVVLGAQNGHVVSAIIGAIAGGNDTHIVRQLCAKHGLNPDDAV